jgi:nitroreductase
MATKFPKPLLAPTSEIRDGRDMPQDRDSTANSGIASLGARLDPAHPQAAPVKASRLNKRSEMAATRIWRDGLKLVRQVFSRLEPVLVKCATRSKCIAAVYYYLVRDSYSREQAAVLAGRQAYAACEGRTHGNRSLLRRNIHRLEKGLLMRPRRVPFGLSFIGETLDAFASIAGTLNSDQAEIQWAHDVLAEYFSVVKTPNAEPHLRRFLAMSHSAPMSERARIPYRRAVPERLPVDIEALLALAQYRRSVRWYLPDRVSRAVIDSAIEIGALAPSACNRQPYQFHILDDPELRDQALSLPGGAAGFAHNVPAVAVLVGQLRNYVSEQDRHLIYIDGCLAAMGFILALESQGVSSCCINWPDIPEREVRMKKLLTLAPDERPIMLIAFGYPDSEGMVAYSAKKSLNSIRSYNLE